MPLRLPIVAFASQVVACSKSVIALQYAGCWNRSLRIRVMTLVSSLSLLAFSTTWSSGEMPADGNWISLNNYKDLDGRTPKGYHKTTTVFL